MRSGPKAPTRSREHSWRIIELADYGGPYPGSFVPMMTRLAERARARGARVEAVFSNVARERSWLREFEAKAIPVRFMPTRPFRAARERISEMLAGFDGPTVLHTHFTSFDLPAVAAATSRRNAAVVWHVHAGATAALPAKLRNVAKYSLVGARVDRILCVSPEAATALRKRSLFRGQIEFFVNAIDTDRFPRITAAERAAARAKLAVPATAAALVHFGWDWERKGGDIFLAAAKLICADDDRDVVAVTVGGGDKARALRDELRLGARVLIPDATADVRTFYAAADAFVAPSRSEGMPYAVAEALATGVPVVASDIPGHRVLCEGLGACRLTSLDANGIAAATNALLARGPAEAEAEADAAAERMRDSFDLRSWCDRLLDLYEDVLDAGRPALRQRPG